MIENGGRSRLVQPRHMLQHMHRRVVQVNANQADAFLKDRGEAVGELLLGEVVLVLTHPKAARGDLHELRQWVLQTPRDRHCGEGRGWL